MMLSSELVARAQHAIVLYIDVLIYCLDKGQPRFLLFKRRSDVVMPEVWQPACGKLSAGKGIKESFTDQVKKKTGLHPLRITPIDYLNTYYDHHYDCVMQVPCAGAEIEDAGVEIDSTLHSEFVWVSYERVTNLVKFAGQLAAYDKLNKVLTCS